MRYILSVISAYTYDVTDSASVNLWWVGEGGNSLFTNNTEASHNP